jgi:DNA polymerase I-like protein with 3'-5' exonuclease and polymerase domains
VFFVHDEIIFETPESKGALAAAELEKVMIAAMERWTPNIPAAASATLMRYWSKKAKPIFEEGELVPWEG